MRHAVAQLVDGMHYKLGDGGFDSRWGLKIVHWQSFQPHFGPGVDSASNRNKYPGGKSGRCVGLTTLPLHLPVVWESWEPQPPGTLTPSLGTYTDSFTYYLNYTTIAFFQTFTKLPFTSLRRIPNLTHKNNWCLPSGHFRIFKLFWDITKCRRFERS